MKDTRRFYLEDNFHGRYTWTPDRRLPDRTGNTSVGIIVLHTPEAVPDLKPPDSTAEKVARYGASLTKHDAPRSASWHASVDSDSIIWMLPDEARAWHVHRYSESALGIELGSRAKDWARPEVPDWWKNSTLENAARVCAFWSVKFDIPPVLLTKANLDRRDKTRGYIYHGVADPKRRSDPGVRPLTFPQDEFFARLAKNIADQRKRGIYVPKAWIPGQSPKAPKARLTPRAPTRPEGDLAEPVKKPLTGAEALDAIGEGQLAIQAMADILGGWTANKNARNPQNTRAVQRLVGAKVDGVYGPETREKAMAWVKEVRARKR